MNRETTDEAKNAKRTVPKRKRNAFVRKSLMPQKRLNTLDYSFCDITSMEDLLEAEPKGRRKKAPEKKKLTISEGVDDERDALEEEKDDPSKDSSQNGGSSNPEQSSKEPPIHSNILKICCNKLESLESLDATMEHITDDPTEYLEWLDASCNKIGSIDPCITKFQKLRVIYLHGNRIRSINEVKKLAKLPNLQKLTLHGNEWLSEGGPGQNSKLHELEDDPYYRPRIIWYLRDTMLRNLDFVPITPKDRQLALLWAKNYRKKPRPKQEEYEEEYY